MILVRIIQKVNLHNACVYARVNALMSLREDEEYLSTVQYFCVNVFLLVYVVYFCWPGFFRACVFIPPHMYNHENTQI